MRVDSLHFVPISQICVREGNNEMTIEVSNEDTPSMYPASADFYFLWWLVSRRLI